MAAPKGKKVIRRRRERKHIEKGAAMGKRRRARLQRFQEVHSVRGSVRCRDRCKSGYGARYEIR